MDKESRTRKINTKGREDRKRRAQAKKITKTTEVRVLILERSGLKKKKKNVGTP
jgi:hypothetical protein